MAKQEELTRFYMSNKELKDSAGNADKSAIKDWNTQVRQMTSALESATNGLVKVIKTIDENGNALATFDVKRSQAGNAQPAFNRVLGNIETRYGYQAGSLARDPYSAGLNQAEDFRRIAFYKSFHGADAKRAVKEAMEAVGGIAVSDPSRKLRDRMRLEFSVSEAEWMQALQNAGGDATKATSSISSSFVRNNLKKAESYSRDVTTNKREREKAKEEAKEKAEAEKAQKAQLKAIEKDKKEKDAASLKNAKLIQKMVSDAAKEEARQKAKKEKEEARQKVKEERESKANRRKMLHWLTIAVSFLAGIADITRRILTASLARASEIKKEQVDAKSLGVTYSDMREYRAQEIAMGLEKGTITAGMSELQAGIGDITNLDQNMLTELAKVLKSKVIKGIELGSGQTDLDNVYKEILNTYFARGQNGVNSAGVQVGKYQAERELATALEKAGLGKLAEVLRNMFYTNDTGIYRGRLSTQDAFSDYMGLTTAYTMGISATERRKASELGAVIDDIKKTFNDLKDNLETGLILSLGGVINKINNLQIGKSAEEKLTDNKNNIKLNLAAYKRLSGYSANAREQYSALFENAGVNVADFGIEGVNTLEDFLAFTNTSKGRYWSPEGNKEREAYNRMIQFLNTEEGDKAIKLVHYAQTTEELANRAKADYENGLKTGNTVYNKADYTESAINVKMKENLTQAWFSEKYSAVNLLHASGKGGNAHLALYSPEDIYQAYVDTYGELTYDKALASGNHYNLTNALYEQAKASYSKHPEIWKKYKKLKKEDLVKQALSDKTLSPFDVSNLAKENAGKDDGWGISNSIWSILQKSLISKGLYTFVEEGAKNNILNEALATQQAQSFLAQANAETKAEAIISGFNEKEGTVNVTIKLEGEGIKVPERTIKLPTDSILPEDTVIKVDISRMVNSGYNRGVTR